MQELRGSQGDAASSVSPGFCSQPLDDILSVPEEPQGGGGLSTGTLEFTEQGTTSWLCQV